jgi:hypothetical protein
VPQGFSFGAFPGLHEAQTAAAATADASLLYQPFERVPLFAGGGLSLRWHQGSSHLVQMGYQTFPNNPKIDTVFYASTSLIDRIQPGAHLKLEYVFSLTQYLAFGLRGQFHLFLPPQPPPGSNLPAPPIFGRLPDASTSIGLFLRFGGTAVPKLALEQTLPVPREESVQSFDNAVFGELGGNGVFGSVNYERMITQQWAVRGGIGFFGTSGTNTRNEAVFNPFISLPFTTAYHLPLSSTSRIEIGGGYTSFVSLSNTQTLETFSPEWLRGPVMSAVTGLAAYRYQSPNGGFIFRAAATPLYFLGESPRNPFQFWAGVSAGFAF